MDHQQLSQTMALNAERIRALVAGVSPDAARWKPDLETWSILEVVNHLYDEERLDFRVRLDIILHRPDEPWPPIDPQGWVIERSYNARELAPSLEAFLAERAASTAWLAGLGAADWEASCAAPWGGVIKAGDMLAAWAAHDLLHLRQLVELHYAALMQAAQPYGTEYAGRW